MIGAVCSSLTWGKQKVSSCNPTGELYWNFYFVFFFFAIHIIALAIDIFASPATPSSLPLAAQFT